MNLPSTFTYNGMLKTDEIAGEGNSYDFGARMHDGRLGRWLSLDPLKEIYPSLSPFCFSGNSPIYFGDKDGEKITPHGQKSHIMLFVTLLQKETSLKVEYDAKSNKIILSGEPKTERDAYLLMASQDNFVDVNVFLYNTSSFLPRDDKSQASFIYGGSLVGAIYNNETGEVSGEQWVNPVTFNEICKYKINSRNPLASHEIIENYFLCLESCETKVSIPTTEVGSHWQKHHDRTDKIASGEHNSRKDVTDLNVNNHLKIASNYKIYYIPNEDGYKSKVFEFTDFKDYFVPKGITTAKQLYKIDEENRPKDDDPMWDKNGSTLNNEGSENNGDSENRKKSDY